MCKALLHIKYVCVHIQGVAEHVDVLLVESGFKSNAEVSMKIAENFFARDHSKDRFLLLSTKLAGTVK